MDPEKPIYSPLDVANILAVLSKEFANGVIPMVVNASLYGVFFALSINALYIQWKKRKSTPSAPNLIVMLVALVLFACLTIYFSLYVFAFFKGLYVWFNSVSNITAPITGGYVEAQAVTKWSRFGFVMMMATVVWISDAVLVWRASVIWLHDIKVIIPLGVALSFTLASSIWYLIAVYIATSKNDGVTLSTEVVSAIKHETLALEVRLLASLCTNWLATLFIACKIWSYRKHILPYVRQTAEKGRTPVYSILTSLVEMGLFLGGYQLCVTTQGFTPYEEHSSKFSAYNTLYSALPFIAGINPILIIILVNNRYSIADATSKDNSAGDTRHPATTRNRASRLIFARSRGGSNSTMGESAATIA